MNEQEMRVAIAEKCGWKMIPCGVDSFGAVHGPLANRGHETILQDKLPNYPRDLNAMHEAWLALEFDEQIRFARQLEYVASRDWNNEDPKALYYDLHLWARMNLTNNATALQRAEAFCRVFWPEKFKN